MRNHRFRQGEICALVITLLLANLSVARAQQRSPHLGYVYPAGGKQGAKIQVKIGGEFLVGVTNLKSNVHFSGTGVHGVVIDYDRPLTQQQIAALRQQAQQMAQGPRDPVTQKQISGIRGQIAESQRRNANPVISEYVTLEIELDSGADPGERELRLRTPNGLSNPLVFCVGQLPEFIKPDSATNTVDRTMAVTLPVTINGQLVPRRSNQAQAIARPNQQFTPGDVDRYLFQARKGQHLVFAATARNLSPFLADAVPGWFQAVLTLFDAQGNELAFCDDYRFHPDPVIHFEIPKDGEYVIQIKDALYRGREDFVYRISLGELPFLTSVFPLGGPSGRSTKVKLSGWNLATNDFVMDCNEKTPGIYPIVSSRAELISNPLPYAVDDLPEALETEPNNAPSQAQRVALPIILNGRVDRPGDSDLFSFEARAGDQLVAEVTARRLESPLDSFLKLTDALGRELAYNDDMEDKGSGLETHHADSFIFTTLPTNGTYLVRLGDIEGHGGPEFAYRLRLSSPRPDFELRVAPSAINALVGPTTPITVYALRKDGFDGAIELFLGSAPRGTSLAGGTIPAHQDKAQVTISVPMLAPLSAASISLEGRAAIGGREITRFAVPADDRMQAFAYRHLVPAQELRISSSGRGAAQAALRMIVERPLRIPAGGSAPIQISLPAIATLEKVQLQLNDPPEGITIGESIVNPPTARVVVQCDATKVKPGLKGNLILNITGQRGQPVGNQPPRQNRPRVPIGTLPAIPFEIVAPD